MISLFSYPLWKRTCQLENETYKGIVHGIWILLTWSTILVTNKFVRGNNITSKGCYSKTRTPKQPCNNQYFFGWMFKLIRSWFVETNQINSYTILNFKQYTKWQCKDFYFHIIFSVLKLHCSEIDSFIHQNLEKRPTLNRAKILHVSCDIFLVNGSVDLS